MATPDNAGVVMCVSQLISKVAIMGFLDKKYSGVFLKNSFLISLRLKVL